MADYENGADEVKGEGQRTPNSSKILKGPPTDTISTEDSLEQKISLRMEIMLKKEKLKQEEEANFTYKPKLFTSPTNKNKPKPNEDPNARENRFDKLYSDALKRHISHTMKEEQKDKDLTFTPKVTKRASSASRSNSASRGNGARSVSRERTSVGSDAVSDGRQTPRSRKSIEPEKPTFKPAISKRAKSIERARDKEVADRLYEHGLHLKEKMERKRVESEQKQLESCSFAPKITENKRSSSASRLDVVERMSKFDELRKKKLQEAVEQKKEAEKNLTFKPTLMAKRSSTPTQLPFHERLAVPQEKTVSHAAMEAMSHLTFKPQLVSKRTPSPNTTRSSEFKSIHERLYHEGEEHRRELEYELRMKRSELDAELTFHPQIISPSPHYSHEPVFERLNAAAERQDVRAKLNRIRSEVTKDWTFQPNISENSKKLVGQRRESSEYSLYERSLAEQRRIEEELQRKKEEQEQERLREATFAPSLPESSKELAKKKLSMGSMDTTDVYSRLLTSPTAASLHEHSNTMTASQVDPNLSRSIILPEKVLTQVFERLATPSVQQMEHYLAQPEQRKVVVPEKEAEEIFNRLSAKKTMSFTFKTHEVDPNKAQHGHSGPHSGPHSPSAKQPLTEETLMARLEQAHHQKSRVGRENSSQVSSITNGSNASKPKKATTPAAKATVTPNKIGANKSGVQRSASKDSVSKHPAPPSTSKNNYSSPGVMPPAPPATAVKGANAGGSVDYQDFAKKLEASLDMINQGNSENEQTKKPVVSSAKKSPKRSNKDSEDFIKSIPTVPDNGELSD